MGKFKRFFDSKNQQIDVYLPLAQPYDRIRKRKLLLDSLICRFVYGTNLNDYFAFQFYRLNRSARKSFLTTSRDYIALIKYANDQKYLALMEDKVAFTQLFSDLMGRNQFSILPGKETRKEYENFIQSEHDRGGYNRFIFKPANGFGGAGIYVLDYEKAIDGYDEAKKIADELVTCGVVIEPVITNEESIAEFHPYSLNTLRMVVLKKAGKQQLVGAYLRIGDEKHSVDNLCSGGMVAEVDIDTGVIFTQACSKKGKRYTFHPVTGKKIVGFQIPFWKEVKELVHLAVSRVDEMNYSCWDIAVTPIGPVIIEGNFVGDTDLQQIPMQMGKKYLYEEILNSISTRDRIQLLKDTIIRPMKDA